MRKVFLDTSYIVALINPRDQLYQKAVALEQNLHKIPQVTTDEVLIEVLTFFSKHGPEMKEKTSRIVLRLMNHKNVTVFEQSRESFLLGLSLYDKRPDKEYSLTDCISMQIMKKHKIQAIATDDHHFQQEGFTVLLKGE